MNCFNKNLIVYGFGSRGKSIIDQLLKKNIHIALIVDKNKHGKIYKKIKIVNLEYLRNLNLKETVCLVALHNNYVDINKIYKQLSSFDFKYIYSLINIKKIVSDIKIDMGYWLDNNFSYTKYRNKISKFKGLFKDNLSLKLINEIIRYRKTGDIKYCPQPSLFDEYTPNNLPRYKSPLRIIDCGAYTGVAIEKFKKAGYKIESFVAFEPDLKNFQILSNKDFDVKDSIFMPLGTWSSNIQLRFSSKGDMGSNIDNKGDTVIQCVSVDNVIRNFKPNIIKFDVEGAEIETIKGLQNTISNNKPNLCISLYHKPDHLFEIPLLINSWNLGYKFYLRVHEYNTFGTVLYCLQDNLIKENK